MTQVLENVVVAEQHARADWRDELILNRIELGEGHATVTASVALEIEFKAQETVRYYATTDFSVRFVLVLVVTCIGAPLAEEVFYRCLDAGLSFKISMGNTLTFTPPLILSKDQMDTALDIVETALTDSARAAGLA